MEILQIYTAYQYQKKDIESVNKFAEISCYEKRTNVVKNYIYYDKPVKLDC